jgi:hypothetical protein
VSATARILNRLKELGFQARRGALAPFGERLPLVSGVAWEEATAQLALVAEMSENDTDDEWRQLFFAASGLRHHLANDHAASFGTPIVLAVVDEYGSRRLRAIAEALAHDYLLFSRVDLNFVRSEDISDQQKLDDALAPLLPRCRTCSAKKSRGPKSNVSGQCSGMRCTAPRRPLTAPSDLFAMQPAGTVRTR